ncbi:MAG: hypothetical protein R3A52_30810 [Polyangiales bacterium]
MKPLLLGGAALAVAAAAGCDSGPYVRVCDGGPCVPLDIGPREDRPSADVRPVDVAPDLFEGLRSVSITPADSTLVVRGEPLAQSFMAVGAYADGSTRPLPVGVWSAADDRLGVMSPGDGRFVATGSVGGATRVRYALTLPSGSSLSAETGFTVRLEREVFVAPAAETDRARFDRTVSDAARRATLRYPLAGAVMPQNVAPPDVQWEGGDTGDVFRVQLRRPHAVLTAFVRHTGAGFRFDGPSRRRAGANAPSDPDDAAVAITVDRALAAGGDAVVSAPLGHPRARRPRRRRLLLGPLRDGKILRILDAPTREDFLPSPPRRSSDGSRCVACHTVSRDGRWMAAEMFEGQGPSTVFDLTTDLTADPAPTRFALDVASWVYASFSPDATRLIANRLGGLFLVDAASGRTVTPSAGTLPRGSSVQPSWSPNGNAIAYVANSMGDGPTAFSSSDLASLPVTGADAFGAPTTLARGADLMRQREGGRAIAYPSWSPDSRYLVFQHGPYSESDRQLTAGAPRTRYPAAMYLLPAGGGSAMRLTRASADEREDDAYFPNFSPFVQGGSYWVLFFSRRDYGNAQAGTRGTGRRQLWVTAVTTSPTPGSDPSSVPYWLPGQDVASDNVSGFWAPQPCRPRGEECSVSSECCTGTCGPDATGRRVCNPPPPETPCRGVGERCGAASDCCEGLSCAANVCLRPPG